jgi:hypothetical protein
LNALPANIKYDLHPGMGLSRDELKRTSPLHAGAAQDLAKRSLMSLRRANANRGHVKPEAAKPAYAPREPINPRAVKVIPGLSTSNSSMPPPALPRGPTTATSRTLSQGLRPPESQSGRTPTFKTPFLKTPTASGSSQQHRFDEKPTTALPLQGKANPPTDTEEGNDSFDLMDLEGMFGDEVEAVMRAYDG